jgi:3',5'-cyclic AMP phosphodiesterase CpdA
LRLAHATDLHWMVPPPLSRLPFKRLIGSANLYLAGRRHHFDPAVQDALVAALVAVAPDALLISGDLTAQALPAEFDVARSKLEHLLQRQPSLVQRGNHDVYTHGAVRDRRHERAFGAWAHGGPHAIARLDVGHLTILGLDPNRPGLLAAGRLPDDQLAALPGALDAVPADRSLVLSLHYPLVDRHGAIYDGVEHGLANARALIATLRAARRRPDLIVHGHVHHGFRAALDVGDASIPICNPGAGGYAWIPKTQRAACFNVYTVQPGQPVEVERWRFDGEQFSPEPGGAYATGR